MSFLWENYEEAMANHGTPVGAISISSRGLSNN